MMQLVSLSLSVGRIRFSMLFLELDSVSIPIHVPKARKPQFKLIPHPFESLDSPYRA